jgi:hypothetical protein
MRSSRVGRALPPPLAGEGWGGGTKQRAESVDPHPRPRPLPARGGQSVLPGAFDLPDFIARHRVIDSSAGAPVSVRFGEQVMIMIASVRI